MRIVENQEVFFTQEDIYKDSPLEPMDIAHMDNSGVVKHDIFDQYIQLKTHFLIRLQDFYEDFWIEREQLFSAVEAMDDLVNRRMSAVDNGHRLVPNDILESRNKVRPLAKRVRSIQEHDGEPIRKTDFALQALTDAYYKKTTELTVQQLNSLCQVIAQSPSPAWVFYRSSNLEHAKSPFFAAELVGFRQQGRYKGVPTVEPLIKDPYTRQTHLLPEELSDGKMWLLFSNIPEDV